MVEPSTKQKGEATPDDVFADTKKDDGKKKSDTVSSNARLIQDDDSPEMGTKGGSKTKYAVQQKGPTVKCKVQLLDGSDLELEIDKKATGQVLLDKICESVNLLEKDYFCCSYKVNADVKFWLQNDLLISKQIKNGPWKFLFELKFYPQDPTTLHEEITRYQVYLQLRVDVLAGKLPCSFVTLALLGSYAVQSQLGDYDADEHGPGIDYIKDKHFAPGQTEELLDKIAELHRTNRGQPPPEAEFHYLENAKNLAMYGVHQFPALNEANEEVVVGICAAGILIYRQRIRLNRFIWVKILKITYKRNRFSVILRPDQGEGNKAKTIVFRVNNYKAAKRLWRLAVEHHTFFRLREPEPAARGIFSRKSYYAGRTQWQTQQQADQIERPVPEINRVYYTVGRFTDRNRSVDGASTPGFSTERTEETMPDSSYRTMTLDLKKRDKFPVAYADTDGGDGGPYEAGMYPVTDSNGRVVYVKKPTPSTSSEVFLTLPGGQRRPSQDDLTRTGERKDGAYVTLLVGPGDGSSGVTYSKTPYPTGPGYVTPGGGPGLGTPGYGTFDGQGGGYQTPGGGNYGGTGSPYYGTDDLHRLHTGSQDDPNYYINAQSMGRYGGSATPGGAPGSQQVVDEHGNVITKSVYISTMQRTVNGRPVDGDDSLPAYQEDHLKQHGYNFGAGGDGTWGPYSTSSTTKTMTRTYTAPDGTIVTEHRTEKNGVVETHIEKRTQMADDAGDFDHDKALLEAILSVTDMNADLTVEKIEIHTKSEDD